MSDRKADQIAEPVRHQIHVWLRRDEADFLRELAAEKGLSVSATLQALLYQMRLRKNSTGI